MLSEEDFKNKHLQHPITFLTEENLDKLETHCRKAVNFERGVEHKVVLELLDKYYQYQKEIKDKNNKITKLQKENEEKDRYIKNKDKQMNLISEYMEENMDEHQLDEIYAKQYNCNGMERNWTRGKEKEVEDIKQFFEKLAKEKDI